MTHEDTCSRCIEISGGCCSNQMITILPERVEPFLSIFEQNKEPPGHVLVYDENQKNYKYQFKGACVFLDNNKNCRIYKKRPLICRIYPVLWRGKPLRFYLDKGCMLTHETHPEEFRYWITIPDNQVRIEYMGPLNFDEKQMKYINLDHLYDPQTWILPVL